MRCRAALQRVGKWTVLSVSAPVVIFFSMALLAPATDLLVEAWSVDGADLSWRFNSTFLDVKNPWKVEAAIFIGVERSLLAVARLLAIDMPYQLFSWLVHLPQAQYGPWLLNLIDFRR